MALGEGAAVVALARTEHSGDSAGSEQPGITRRFITGFGASSDAVHITAPDRTGSGLARAARSALKEAGDPVVDLVSPHATATPFNDAAEWRALVTALGEGRARAVPCHPFKAQIGHTLGAAGALELLACTDALARGVLPASAGDGALGALDPETPARLLEVSEPGRPRTALKLSAAFGGANAALVVSSSPGPRDTVLRHAFVHAAVHVASEPSIEELAAATGVPIDRLARTDSLVRLVLAAVGRLQARTGALRGAGIVVGTALATLETNALFAARIRERGARAAEPRRFPYTSPNAAPGECAIAFGLTGPAFAVGGGLHAGLEALAAAALLVESADADRVVVVAVDDVGPATKALAGDTLRVGAVAAMVSAEPRGAHARVGAIEIVRGRKVVPVGPFGHEALLPLVDSPGHRDLTCASSPDFWCCGRTPSGPAADAFARVRLDPV
jgi:3-oxoacyl-[acyl-carrier-protein] synthase-1/3-oxoacyl-[acyl-carrier-protein] synthase II